MKYHPTIGASFNNSFDDMQIFGHSRLEMEQRAKMRDQIRKRAATLSLDSSIVSDKSAKTNGVTHSLLSSDDNEAHENHFDSLYSSVIATGEVEKVTEGCFENYLSVLQSDHVFDKTLDCLDWLVSKSI